ncbi:MAG: glycosyltransferase family 4 protein [Tepidisphaeraceae bacterium]|jgi:glycosyltransferase involved in cell wall biosynthesis
MPRLQWIVSQIGSRELYACPLSFHRRGCLRLFYTDLWCRHFAGLFHRLPRPFWGFSHRFNAALPPEKVVSFTAAMFLHDLRHRVTTQAKDNKEVFLGFNETGRFFASRVADQLRRQTLSPASDAVFAFSTGALETIQFARERGVFCVVDQLDPGRVDDEMVHEETTRWEGWEAFPGRAPDEYYDRLVQEWQTADMIVVNSEFSRRAIHKQGAPLDKLLVVPLAYEVEAPVTSKVVPGRDTPLEVLWLGQIVLRKGIPYLFEAARLLLKENIRFRVAGRIGISETAVKSAPANVQVIGPVVRKDAITLFRKSDVFVLPTVSEGFALTQIEAMSYGLPVITTPNCGDVVTPGSDGYIIPIRDPAALAEAILKFHQDRALLQSMADNAIHKSRQFTLDRYARTIEEGALQRRAAK